MALSKKYKAKLISKSVKTPNVNTFVFSIDQELEFIPGQYIFLEIPGFEIKRPFSILNYDKERKELSLGIKKQGDFTSKLWTLEINAEVLISGPYGRFSTDNTKVVFVAGGIGITPIYNMIISRSNKNDFIFYSSRTQEEMPYLEEVSKLDLNKMLFFTRQASDKGMNCRVSSDIIIEELNKNKENVAEYDFMICGPENMIFTLKQQLLDSGIKNEKIKSEVF